MVDEGFIAFINILLLTQHSISHDAHQQLLGSLNNQYNQKTMKFPEGIFLVAPSLREGLHHPCSHSHKITQEDGPQQSNDLQTQSSLKYSGTSVSP